MKILPGCRSSFVRIGPEGPWLQVQKIMQKSIKPIWWRASWFWSGWEQKEKWSRFSWLVWESQDYLFRIYLFAAILHLIRYIFVIVISVQSHVSSYFCTTSNWPKILCTSPNLKISRYWYQNQSFVYVKIFVNLKGVKINRFLTSKYSSNQKVSKSIVSWRQNIRQIW